VPEYTIIAKIDPSGVSAGRAKISQELSGIEADARRTGGTSSAALDGMAAAGGRAGRAAGALGVSSKAAATDASAMAAAAQASARASVAQAAGFEATTKAARLNSVAMRETLVVARELSRGNFTRLPGSLTLLGQGVASQGGLKDYATALLSTFGILRKTQDAELALAAADAQAAASGVRAAAERAAANIAAADTELLLAESAVVVSTSSATEAAAQTRLAAAHVAVVAAAADAAVAEDALAVAEGRAAIAAVASAEATTTGLNPVAIVIGVVIAAATALYFAFRNTGNAAQDEADKLETSAKKADLTRQAHEIFAHTLAGVEEALRKNKEAIDKENDANKTSAEIELQNAALQEVRLQRIYDETAATLQLASARYEAQKSVAASAGQRGEVAALGLDQALGQVDELQRKLAQTRADQVSAAADYNAALANYAVVAGQRDQADDIKRRYEGPGGLIDQAKKAALAASAAAKASGDEVKAHRAVTTELTKQIELIHAKEKAELAAASAAESAAKKAGAILALPISGGRITTGFGQIESGVGVGPHAHQGIDIATPVGSPVYARAGGTVDYARQERGYGNIIQINFGGGVSGRFAHLQKFNVKPGDVVEAGDVIGYTGGARGADGSGDSTGPHLHYEERVGGHPVNPLTAKVQIDTAGAQASGYKQAEEAAKKAAETAQAERDFVTSTIDAANETALPKVEALTAKIKKVMDDYQKRFHQAMSAGDAAKVTEALTEADSRTIAQHFKEAYVDPLAELQAGLGKTAVERQISTATIKEEAALGRTLKPAEEEQIRRRYQMGDVLERENKILTDIRQPLEDYRQQLKALNDLLASGSINQTQFNARVAELGANASSVLKDLPGKDPVSGRDFADVAARQEEQARYAQQQDQIESLKNQNTASADNNLLQTGDWDTYHKTLLDIQRQYEAEMEASHRQHIENMNDIDAARRDLQLSYAQSIADSVYQIAVAAFGKQSAIARATFAIEKAFTIARAALSLYQNVSKAMAIGFPQNLPFIAAAFAQGATIASAIASVVAPSAGGFREGGYTGDGDPDSVAGVVHGREFVSHAAATARHRPLLEAINSGRLDQQGRTASNDNAGIVRAPSVTVHNYAGVEIEARPGPTPGDIEIIARRVVREDSPKAIAADLANPNGKTSKAMAQHYSAGRSRK
jgi:murein DD-endopeptidase MepM/ murein hydrolase activator NlpD